MPPLSHQVSAGLPVLFGNSACHNFLPKLPLDLEAQQYFQLLLKLTKYEIYGLYREQYIIERASSPVIAHLPQSQVILSFKVPE